MIQTIKTQREFKPTEGDELQSSIDYVKAVYDMSDDDISKLTVDKVTKMAEESISQNTAIEPVYLFEYKNTLYGYYPIELFDLSDLIAYEYFMKSSKMNALASLLFREVIWHNGEGNFDQTCGLKSKIITDFNRNSKSYEVKKDVPANVDIDYWDELPYQIISSSVNFSLGLGLSLLAATSSYSPKEQQSRIELLTKLYLNLCNGTSLQYLCQLLDQESQTSSDSQEPSPSKKLELLKHSTGNLKKSSVIYSLQKVSKEINLRDDIIEKLILLQSRIYSDYPLNKTDINLMSKVNGLANKTFRYGGH